jgi:hypothetical protein
VAADLQARVGHALRIMEQLGGAPDLDQEIGLGRATPAALAKCKLVLSRRESGECSVELAQDRQLDLGPVHWDPDAGRASDDLLGYLGAVVGAVEAGRIGEDCGLAAHRSHQHLDRAVPPLGLAEDQPQLLTHDWHR